MVYVHQARCGFTLYFWSKFYLVFTPPPILSALMILCFSTWDGNLFPFYTNVLRWFNDDFFEVVQALPIIMFAFTCQVRRRDRRDRRERERGKVRWRERDGDMCVWKLYSDTRRFLLPSFLIPSSPSFLPFFFLLLPSSSPFPSFFLQVNVFAIYTELERQSQRRMGKVS